MYHDNGPSLRMDHVFIQCRENNDNFPDSGCGSWGADNGDGNFTLGTGSFTSPRIYGNRLNDSNDYFSTIGGYFYPTGYPRFTMATLKSGPFNCFGTSNCIFPNA